MNDSVLENGDTTPREARSAQQRDGSRTDNVGSFAGQRKNSDEQFGTPYDESGTSSGRSDEELSAHEGEDSSWRIPPSTLRELSANVRGSERVGSGLLGSAILIWGARRHGVPGALAIAGGLGLLARAATGHCPVKRALVPSSLASSIARSQGWSTATVTSAEVTIARPREEVYALWRDFSRLPDFMTDIESIEVITPLRSRWTVKAPMGKTLAWTSFVTQDVKNERIAWESEVGAEVSNFGSVKFRDAPDGRGTEISAMIAYQPPYSTAGRLLGAVLRKAPEHQMKHNLRRLKKMLESEEGTADSKR